MVPDVTATRRQFCGPYPTDPVEICIEILSSDDRLKKTAEKGGRYIEWGVGFVWIIDPVARRALVQTPENPDGSWVEIDGFLPTGESAEIPVAELFSEVDKLL